MRHNAWFAFVLALGMSACSGGSGSTPTAPASTAPSPAPVVTATATASPSPAPSASSSAAPDGEGALTISFYIPAPGTTNAARHRQFISAYAKSLLAIIDEPDIDQTNLQHRMEPHNLVPNPVTGLATVTLYAPPGSVTLQLKLFTGSNATGYELARTDKKTLTIQDDTSVQTVDVTFNPIITSVSLSIISTATHVANCDASGSQTIVLTSGNVYLKGYDAAKELVEGAGRFLDTNGNDINITLSQYNGPSFGIFGPVFQPIAISANPLTAPESAGTYSLGFAGAANPFYSWVVAVNSGSSPVSGAGPWVIASGFCNQIIGG